MTSILVTGSEWSGLGYTAAVIRAAGIDAGHERAVNVNGWRRLKDGEVEVSWLAGYLDVADYTIHQVRHPLYAIAASVKRGTFDPASKYWRWAKYAIDRYPEIGEQPTPLLRAAAYWLLWNGGIVSDERWQVEHLTARLLNKALKASTAAALRETPIVHPSDAEPLEWDQLGAMVDAIQAQAAEYGYEVPVVGPIAEEEPEAVLV